MTTCESETCKARQEKHAFRKSLSLFQEMYTVNNVTTLLQRRMYKISGADVNTRIRLTYTSTRSIWPIVAAKVTVQSLAGVFRELSDRKRSTLACIIQKLNRESLE